MNNKAQRLVRKLPSNAAIFVGSLTQYLSTKFAKEKDHGWYESLLFTRGAIYLFISSSMLAVFNNAKSVPVRMAAILLRLFWTLFCLIYLLHKSYNNWLNNTSSSYPHVNYISAHFIIDFIMNATSTSIQPSVVVTCAHAT